MDKMEQFKKFASSKPFLKKKVDNKETSWQELYEKYDIYGEDDPIFKEDNSFQRNENGSFSSFMDMINNIDIDKITDGLNGMKKVLSILSEITKKDDTNNKRKMNQPYEKDID
jgi:hypothetical protein